MRVVLQHTVAVLAGVAAAWCLRPDAAAPTMHSPRPITPPLLPKIDRRPPAAASLASFADADFARIAAQRFGQGGEVDGWALRCFIEEWLHRDVEGAVRAFSEKDGPLARHAGVFLQLLAEHDEDRAIRALETWPDSTGPGGTVHLPPRWAAARVLGRRNPAKWLEFFDSEPPRWEDGFAQAEFYRGWAGTDCRAAFAQLSKRDPANSKFLAFTFCEEVPTGSLGAILEQAMQGEGRFLSLAGPLFQRLAKIDPDKASQLLALAPEGIRGGLTDHVIRGMAGAAAGRTDVASMQRWLAEVHPESSAARDQAQAAFVAAMTDQPGGLKTLIEQTTGDTWTTRKKEISTFINLEAGRDPAAAWQFLHSMGESAAARVIPMWLERAPDDMAAYAAAHPDATQVREAVLEAARRFGVLEALTKQHPKLAD